jgi:L-rhamnose mutarotase
MSGYEKMPSPGPVRRYCQALELVDDPKLIEEYKYWHSPAHIWPEIPAGIRSVGILDMEIYLIGNKLFMIIETPVDFDWNEAFGRLATLERQAEWEDFVGKFQVVKPGSTSSQKWQMIERIFSLPK